MKKIVFLFSTLLISHTLMAADQKDITADNRQRGWLTYRDSYCEVATIGEQETHFIGAAWTGCTINMNKRRIKEIQLIVVETTR